MIDALKARIAEMVPAIKLVGDAADFQSAAETNPTVTPAVFVFPVDEQPGPNLLGDSVIQRVKVSVGVTLVTRNLSDAKGVAASADMEVLRKAVKEQVYGWQAQTGFDPFERGHSHLLAFKDGHLWWQDIYLTAYYDRSIL